MKRFITNAVFTTGIMLAPFSAIAADITDTLAAKYKLSEQAFADNNTQVLLNEFYASDVYVVGEGSAPLSGHEQLAPVLKELVEGATKIELTPERTNHKGKDTVYDFVNYRVFPSDGSEDFNVRSLLVWQKIKGDWRVIADMYTFGEYKESK
ncbi:hypothetical protein [Amphritea sp. HPY]|uniref:hypothetical protein n=1 Tax=Amphritea sp. HPY TaxID=3421652 RepID=UPI003D7D581E